MTFQWRSIVSTVTFATTLESERPRGLCAMRRAVGSQAFYNKNAFNQALGEWNVASVTDLSYVCSLAAHRVRVRAYGGRA